MTVKNFVRDQSSQKDAAKKLKISPSYLGDILNGKREVSKEVAAKFGFRRELTFFKGK